MKTTIPITITHPKIVKDWDFERNPNLDPSTLTFGSEKKVNWHCKICDFKWLSSITERCRRQIQCPNCKKNKPKSLGEKSLLFKRPELIFEWSFKNKTMDQYSLNSHHKVLWICSENHEYECRIADKTGNKNL